MSTLPLHTTRDVSVLRRLIDDITITSTASVYAVDLHLHSPHAGGTSPQMTLENILRWARWKGIDLIGTGDCLHPARRAEIAACLEETPDGFLVPRAEQDDAALIRLPQRLRRPLRFVLTTEVCCCPIGTNKYKGLHHLIFFRSLASVERFAARVAIFGDLSADGRPELRLTSAELLHLVVENGEGTELAPAHILSPWYSSLGSVGGKFTLEEIYRDLTPLVLGIEAGTSARFAMCRRIASLDAHALFCNSDAHSLDHIAREYMCIELAKPSYGHLMQALQDRSASRIRQAVKLNVFFSGYYYNWCSACEKSYAAQHCPQCHRPLTMGTADRTELIASRPTTTALPVTDLQLLPLADLLARRVGLPADSDTVQKLQRRYLEEIGHERHILTEATESALIPYLGRDLAEVIVQQRIEPLRPGWGREDSLSPVSEQLALDF